MLRDLLRVTDSLSTLLILFLIFANRNLVFSQTDYCVQPRLFCLALQKKIAAGLLNNDSRPVKGFLFFTLEFTTLIGFQPSLPCDPQDCPATLYLLDIRRGSSFCMLHFLSVINIILVLSFSLAFNPVCPITRIFTLSSCTSAFMHKITLCPLCGFVLYKQD